MDTSLFVLTPSCYLFIVFRNEGEMLGVALRAEAGTAVILRGCDFNKNVAKRHGTIFNRGTMTVEECNFSLNRGKVS